MPAWARHMAVPVMKGAYLLCVMLVGKISHATKSWAMAKGPLGYVDLMAVRIGTMLYSFTLKWVAMASLGPGLSAAKT